MGAVVGGIGMALHEEAVIDHHYGRTINHNFAEYHVPVNADVHDIEVIFVDEREDSPQPAGHQRRRRDRHRRRSGGDRKCGIPRDRACVSATSRSPSTRFLAFGKALTFDARHKVHAGLDRC